MGTGSGSSRPGATPSTAPAAAPGKPLTCDTAADCTKILALDPGGLVIRFHGGPDPLGVELTDPRIATLPADPVAAAPPPKPGAPARVVTLTDVARFLPAQSAVHSEPDGWAVVGDPANFWVDVAGPQVVQGELLGLPAQVRFTPDEYIWSYGDGQGRTSNTPGASWATLNQPQLTATATSHVYAARGHDAVTVQIAYTADYRVGGGVWLPVRGLVFGRTAAAPILVVREGTVLTPD